MRFVGLVLFGQLVACSSDAPSSLGESAGAGGVANVAGTSNRGGAGSAGTSAAGAGGSTAGAAGSAGAGAFAGTGGVGVTGGAGGASGGAGPVLTGTVPMMVLGSSNELGTCWRAFLWQKLHAAGITSFDFVGGVTSGPDCGVPDYDKDLQAKSGIIISDLKASDYAGWFQAHPPRVILMHFGGADLLSNKPIDGVMKAYELALAQARLVNPKVYLLIGEHTPQGGANCSKCSSDVMDLNARIAAWAPLQSTADSPVIAVDLFTGVDAATDTSDGTHLNESGSSKVASKWFEVLKPLFEP